MEVEERSQQEVVAAMADLTPSKKELKNIKNNAFKKQKKWATSKGKKRINYLGLGLKRTEIYGKEKREVLKNVR